MQKKNILINSENLVLNLLPIHIQWPAAALMSVNLVATLVPAYFKDFIACYLVSRHLSCLLPSSPATDMVAPSRSNTSKG